MTAELKGLTGKKQGVESAQTGNINTLSVIIAAGALVVAILAIFMHR